MSKYTSYRSHRRALCSLPWCVEDGTLDERNGCDPEKHEEMRIIGGIKYCCKETRFSTLTWDGKDRRIQEFRRITRCQLPLTGVSGKEAAYERSSQAKERIAGYVIREENPMPGTKRGSR
jgi:hypothetical protein